MIDNFVAFAVSVSSRPRKRWLPFGSLDPAPAWQSSTTRTAATSTPTETAVIHGEDRMTSLDTKENQ